MIKGQYEAIGYKQFKELPDYRQKYLDPGLATVSQISCLMGLISDYRFADGSSIRKVLEVGVHSGVTSLYMLKVGAKNPEFKFYDIDKNDSSFIGSACLKESSPEELSHWVLVKGKTAFDIETILPEHEILDLIFIDGAHAHPYPLLDLLFLLPYLRQDGLIILHDVETYVEFGEQGNSYLYSAWPFFKYLNWNVDNASQTPIAPEYMGIMKKPSSQEWKVFEAMLLLVAQQEIHAPRFIYGTKDGLLGIYQEDLEKLREYLVKHYSPKFVEDIYRALSNALEVYYEQWPSKMHTTRIIHDHFNMIISLHNGINQLLHRIQESETAAEAEKNRLFAEAEVNLKRLQQMSHRMQELENASEANLKKLQQMDSIVNQLRIVEKILPYGSFRRKVIKKTIQCFFG